MKIVDIWKSLYGSSVTGVVDNLSRFLANIEMSLARITNIKSLKSCNDLLICTIEGPLRFTMIQLIVNTLFATSNKNIPPVHV
jgi:hypothetical protein